MNRGNCQRAEADDGCDGPVDLSLAVVGAYDVHLDEAGVPHACDVDCNATAVCMTLEMEGTTITGLATP